MSKIVYHGTLSNGAPHTWGSPFHAGTLRAASDRIDDEIQHGWGEDDMRNPEAIGIGQMHSYEISDDAPKSRHKWADPDGDWLQRELKNGKPTHPYIHDQNVPEHKENRIYPYTNIREDKGSTSYVIPSSFVGTHVKYLNTTQFLFNADKEDESSIMGAISTMAGGPFKR